ANYISSQRDWKGSMSLRPFLSVFLTFLLVCSSFSATPSAFADSPDEDEFPASTELSESTNTGLANETAVHVPFADRLAESAPADVSEADEGDLYVEGEVLVTLAPQSAVEDVETTLLDASVAPTEVLNEEAIVNQNPVTVAIADGQSVAQKIDELMATEEVVYAQPNYLYSFDYVPNDSVLAHEGKEYWWHLSDIDAFGAWDLAKVGKSVRVATIDSGVKADHVDLIGTLDLDDAYNTISGAHGSSAVDDRAGHGTHVAGIIAAQADNGIGTAGVSFNAELVPINVVMPSGPSAGKSTTTEFLKALNYIMGLGDIRVVNISMGTYVEDPALSVAVDAAVDSGIVVVAAGGNEAKSSPSYPADLDSVISVTWYASTGIIDRRSDYGPGKDIAAPGTNIYSTVNTGSDGYCFKQGSSMASPVVAGVCALVLAANPSLTVNQVKTILYETANDAGDPGWDPVYGWGKIDAQAAVIKALTTDSVRGIELSGTDRVATSVAIAKKTYPMGPEGVIIVRSDNFPDALAASALAGVKKYPIVLCSQQVLSPAVKAYITSSSTIKEVILVGDSNALSESVKTSLTKLVPTCLRIKGVDRYDTARLLREAAAEAGASNDVAIIARGDNFPDALSISPYCSATGAPLFLIAPTQAPDSAMISELKNYATVLVVGGYDSVSSEVESALQPYPIEVRRLAGGICNNYDESRYGTSAAIADWIVTKADAGFTYDGAAFATGLNFPDALAGGPFCGLNKAPVLLVDQGSYETAYAAAELRQIDFVYWLGSTSTLSSSVRGSVYSILNS
ncbi:MAG: S8 family serine peptidase, partial [Raoultibacter sp.]